VDIPRVAGLHDKISSNLPLLVLDALDIRDDLIACELFIVLRNLTMLVSKVFRRENVGDVAIFNKKAATDDSLL